MSDERQPVYEVVFEGRNGQYRCTMMHQTVIRMKHGASEGPHSPEDFGYDEFFDEATPVTVWIHGSENVAYQAWKIARREFPYLRFVEPLKDDEA